jgi:hypothetical protein
MKKPGNGSDGEGWGQAGGGEPKTAEKILALFWGSPERAFFTSTALTALCFLSHICFLLLVGPPTYSALSKDSAFAYSSIPLFIGVVLFLAAIYSFRRIESHSGFHIAVFVLAIIFGSLTIHGLIGFTMHLVRRSYGI